MYCPNCKKETDQQICPTCGTNLNGNNNSENLFFVSINNQNAGPYNIQQLRDLIQKGQLNKHTMVWKQGMPQWTMAESVIEISPLLQTTLPPPPPPIQPLINTTDNRPFNSGQKQTTKAGEIKKCPICGQTIPSGAAICPECGYAFHTGQKDDSLITLQKELREIDALYNEKKKEVSNETKIALQQNKPKEREQILFDEKEKISDLNKEQCERKSQAIRNIVVGNSRGELLTFLAFCKPKANPFGPKEGYNTEDYYGSWDNILNCFSSEDLSFAYWSLFENCINMAQINFLDDNAFDPFFRFYAKKDDPNTFKNFYLKPQNVEFKYAKGVEFDNGSPKKKQNCFVQVLLAPFRLIWWIIKGIAEILLWVLTLKWLGF